MAPRPEIYTSVFVMYLEVVRNSACAVFPWGRKSYIEDKRL